jgi:hypothetical protein
MKKLLFKLFFFFLCVAFVQMLVYTFSFEKISEFEATLSERPDVILFGSSVNKHIPQSDKDRRYIHQMLADTLPNVRVMGVSGGAYHLELYQAFIDNLIAEKKFKGTLIIPINLRSFSPEWDIRPEYQFEPEKLVLRKGRYWGGVLINLSVFKYKYTENTISNELFLKTLVYKKDSLVGNVADFLTEIDVPEEKFMKEGFLFQYMYKLTPQHRKIKALENIAKMLQKANLRALFYTTPIDCEKANNYYPQDFQKIVSENIQVIANVIQKNATNSIFIDLTCASSHSGFDYTKRANEHLNQKGKKIIIQTLYPILKNELLKK